MESLKKYIPPRLKNILTSFFYGWHGNYKSWEEAVKDCSGYDSELILEKVRNSLLVVKQRKAVYERDSVLFDKMQYSYPLLSALMWIASQNGNKLCLIDFGGSLGSTYFQNKLYLEKPEELQWCIVEQNGFVKTGREYFADEKLHFFFSIEECLSDFKPDTILLSSVLQYLEDPYDLIDKIDEIGFRYVIIDRTPFISGKDRITVQKVNPRIYKGSYPCRFFNRDAFIERMGRHYERMYEFEALDKANIKSEFKGFLFRNTSMFRN